MVVAASLSALVLPAPLAHAVEEAATAVEPSEGQRALAEAKSSGVRVEVAGERSEYDTVFANPDGFTFTMEQSVVPVRAAKPGGGWQAVDATLENRADGMVAPRAAAVDMAFSAGGSDSLVTMTDGGRSLSLTWPRPLPTPRISGSEAVYPDVFPDVDLKLTATTESFRQVLIVRTPEAAADPALRKLTLGLSTKGLTVRQGAAGNLTAVDPNGRTVFRAPPAQMWDSAGTADSAQPEAAVAARSAVASAAAPASEDSGPGLEPGQGDNVAKVAIHLTEDSLAVVPDADMMEGTEASDFPLFIDPTVTWGESERTLLRSDGYESYGWDNGDDDQGKGVGKCGTWSIYYCGPGYQQRLYYEFSPASLKGKQVLKATFRVSEPWAFQCEPRWVDLWRTNNISSTTTWASRPKSLDLMGDRNVSAGRGSACDPDSPTAPIDFTDNADETNENLTPTVRDFAAGKFSRLTLMLAAHDEGDASAWKRFRNDGVLVVDFVGLPAKPTGIGIVTGSGTVCETHEADPAIVSDPTPLLSSVPQTAAGGEKDAQLRVAMAVDKKNADGTWSAAMTTMERPTTGYVGDNPPALNASTPTLTEGTLYRYRSWTRSYYNGGASQLPGPSNGSTTGWCFFKVDPTAPKAPVVTANSVYTLCTATCLPAGGPNVKGSFTFAAGAGDANSIVAYRYKQANLPTWSAELPGSEVKRDVVPEESGTYQLEVQAKDTVGRWGARQLVSFLVKEGDGPVGRWHFDEESGAAVDSSTTTAADRDNAVLSASASRDDRGRRGELWYDDAGQPLDTAKTDRGLVLDGKTGYAATAGPVLETRSAYTFSAWVRLEPGTGDRLVLSQDGAHFSPFAVWYDTARISWCFGSKAQDADATTAYLGKCAQVNSAQQHSWTHLAGSYDPVSRNLAFYVNGKLSGTANVAGGWASTGGLQIGRYKWNDVYRSNFSGSIDEVAVWQRVLSGAEVAKEARSLSPVSGLADTELVADWDAAGATGSALPDTSGYGRDLPLAAGGSLDGTSLVLDGTGGALTSGPMLDDTGSFTVSAQVELDPAALGTKNIGYVGQVAGQRAADGTSWGLWFELTGREKRLDDDGNEYTASVGYWRFGRVDSDGTARWVTSDEFAEVGTPVRLTGVYGALDDSGVPKIELYVGLIPNDQEKAYTAVLGTGEFAVGQRREGSAWGGRLVGRVDDIRLWAGAMTSVDQLGQAVGTDATD
ncbi:LamG domain-containing protein [Streptomyces sp. NBC_00102]|uniref:LamG domain-containing protein n=1 Tax=Streptomyces sp. NBC_00102 TaxID=2975652 RepID=UPI002252E623|nr:LamG domain-containing protein [Streptomyces sp. NBC_00102]MCX5400744.1 LamG domain-containing protein [Streptomyces sp. NBC_00102]